MGLSMNFANELKNIILSNRCKIANLDLSKNNFGDEGALVLMKAVRNNKELISLNLASNELTNDAIKNIFNMLIGN